MICTAALSGENICFPFARQGARLLRQTDGRKDEEVALVTSLPPDKLDATQWLQANRDGWGIENGLHQRLDISFNDDRCRVQSDRGMLLLGAYRRVAISLFMEWRSHQPNARHRHQKLIVTNPFLCVRMSPSADASIGSASARHLRCSPKTWRFRADRFAFFYCHPDSQRVLPSGIFR